MAVAESAATHDDPGDTLKRLYRAVSERARTASPGSRTCKLIAGGIPKMAQKVVEEAAEVAIEAVRGERQLLVKETADLFYNLIVLLNQLNVPLEAVWGEMARREQLYGIAEKPPKVVLQTLKE
jgi:phosphoribosyl-ATP pyrophosphohydrolase